MKQCVHKMRRIYFESDFKLRESIKSDSPLLGFRFTYYTKGGRYVASWDGKTCQNCKREDDGTVVVVFENHRLGLGQVRCKREFMLADADFGDGSYNVFSDDVLDIVLTADGQDFQVPAVTTELETPYTPPEVLVEGNTLVIVQGSVEREVLVMSQGEVEQKTLIL